MDQKKILFDFHSLKTATFVDVHSWKTEISYCFHIFVLFVIL